MKSELLNSMFVWVVAWVAVLSSVSHSEIVQWSSSAGGNDHFYEVVTFTDGIGWPLANLLAMTRGGYLATITSAAENSFVYSLLDYNEHFFGPFEWGPWLGGYQPAGSPEPGGGWRWVTGEPFVYTNWSAYNPDNYQGIEDFLQFYQGPGWNDIAPNGTWSDQPMHHFIVEYDVPEPVTCLLFGLGSLILLRRRNRFPAATCERVS